MAKQPLSLDPDRLFPADPHTRDIARQLYAEVEHMPIISPHGHVPAEWLADNTPFDNPTTLLLTPDHYTNRLIHSTGGVELSELGVPVGSPITEEQARKAFRLFCANWKYLRGTTVAYWFANEFVDVFGIDVRPAEDTADEIYDAIQEKLNSPEFLPRALYHRFNINTMATTDDPSPTWPPTRSWQRILSGMAA